MPILAEDSKLGLVSKLALLKDQLILQWRVGEALTVTQDHLVQWALENTLTLNPMAGQIYNFQKVNKKP